MNEVIKRPKGSINYLSPTVQNELIECLSKAVQTSLINKILKCSCFSIIMDTTQDITKVDELSIIIRYIEIEKEINDRPSNLNITESFLGFVKVTDQTAAGMTDLILNSLKNLGLNLKKYRGQGYDGASTMSGVYSGVQKWIKDIEPTTMYTHCFAHKVNLIINDAMSSVRDIDSFL